MSYPSMLDIPADIQIDIVVIFRNPRFTAQAVSEVVLWKKRSGQNPVIWTQFGVSTPEAATLAEQAGLAYVENACIAVEYVKYVRN